MTDEERKLHECYIREYLLEEYRGKTRLELIQRIRDLEVQLKQAEERTNDSNNTENDKEPS